MHLVYEGGNTQPGRKPKSRGVFGPFYEVQATLWGGDHIDHQTNHQRGFRVCDQGGTAFQHSTTQGHPFRLAQDTQMTHNGRSH